MSIEALSPMMLTEIAVKTHPRNKTTIFAFIIVFNLGLANGLSAGEALITYADDISLVSVIDEAGDRIDVYIGDTIPDGYTIETGETALELEIESTGNIIRLDTNTIFTIEAIAVGESSVQQSFVLSLGRVRSVVATLTGDEYRVRTPTAVFGVRGTDFTQEVVPGEVDILIVNEGSVDVERESDGSVVSVEGGNSLDVRGRDFRPARLADGVIEREFDGLRFEARDPDEVRERRNYGPGGPRRGETRPRPRGGEGIRNSSPPGPSGGNTSPNPRREERNPTDRGDNERNNNRNNRRN